MSTNRHNVRRGNVADKRTSRKSRAAAIARADAHANTHNGSAIVRNWVSA